MTLSNGSVRLLAVSFALVVAACGGESTPQSSDGSTSGAIDRSAWRAELIAAGGVSEDADLDALEKLTREDCKTSVDSLAIRFSLSGARPDITRINMKYICPDQKGKVDDALAKMHEAGDAVDIACSIQPSLRTQEQQALVDAVGCG